MQSKGPPRKTKPAAPAPPDTDSGTAFLHRRLPQLFAVAAGGIALLALAGWQMNARFLAGQWGDYIPMAPSTALAFLLLGGALFSSARWPSQRWSRLLALAALSLVSLLSLLVLGQFITGIDLGVEYALSRTNEVLGRAPLGRMSPVTALSFLLESAALVILLIGQRWPHASTAAVLHAIVATAVNSIVLTGYAYGVPLLSGGPTVPTAFPTAVAFVLVGIALIRMIARDVPALRAWSRASLRGRLLRAILPPVLLVLLIEGWMEVYLEPILRVNRALWHSLSVLTVGVLILAVIGWIARRTADTIEQAQTALSNSESRYRRLFETAIDGILILDAETGMVVDANPFMIKMLGFSHEDFLGKRIWELGFLKDSLADRDKFTELQQKGYLRFEDLPLETADGRRIEFEFASNAYQVDHQKMIQCNIRDITERKRAEEALRDSEERYRDLVENSQDLICTHDPQGNLLFVNEAGTKISGYSNETLLRMNLRDILAPEVRDRLEAYLAEIQAKGQAHGLMRTQTASGEIRYLEFKNTLQARALTAPIVSGMARDVTERKQAEDALRASEEHYRAVAYSANDAIISADSTGNIVGWNPGAERIFGYTESEVRGQPLTLLMPSRYHERHLAGMARVRSGEEPHIIGKTVEVQGLRKDRREFPLELSLAKWERAKSQFYTAIIRDITERKQAEEALRAGEELYYRLFENMLNGFAYCKMLFDQGRPQDFIYLDVNIAFESLTGLKNVVGKNVSEVIPGIRESDPELFEIYGRVALSGRPERFEIYVKALNMWFSISVYSPQKEYFVAVFDVITEQKWAEEAVKNSEKRFRALIENGRDNISLLAADGTLLWESPSTTSTLGYAPNQFVGHNIFELMHPDDQAWTRNLYAQVVQTPGSSQEGVFRLLHGDGGWRWIEATATNLLNEPIVQAIVINYRDITARKQAEAAVRKKDERHRNVVESIFRFVPEGLLVFTENLSLVKQNQAFEEIVQQYAVQLGYSEQELADLIAEQVRRKILSRDTTEIQIPKKAQ